MWRTPYLYHEGVDTAIPPTLPSKRDRQTDRLAGRQRERERERGNESAVHKTIFTYMLV